MLCTPFCFTSLACFNVTVGGRVAVNSFLNSASASAGDFFDVISAPPIFSGRSGSEMKNTTCPLPSALRKISCSMLKQPDANRQQAVMTVYAAIRLDFISLTFSVTPLGILIQPGVCHSLQRYRFSSAVIDPIEQKLET